MKAKAAEKIAAEIVSTATRLLQSSGEFVKGFTPPDYLIDGLLQRRFVYSLTGPTGAGKTCIAMRIALHVAEGLPLAGMAVEKGRVLFFAGENPDDVRTRWIKLCEEMGYDPKKLDVFFLPGSPAISNDEIRKIIDREAAEHGPFSLLIIDTSAAYFQGDDENSNKQLGDHARMLRSFVNLPGGPTILITCHPTKNPDMTNLLPRGAGAFLAEVDGNLATIKDPDTMAVEVTTHGKFRGPEFAPFSFKLTPGTSDKLVDTKSRKVWTITATPISNEEQTALEDEGTSKQDDLLRCMFEHPGLSLSELAGKLFWLTRDNHPNKSQAQRTMDALVKAKLAQRTRYNGRYALTKKGEDEAAALKKPKHLSTRAASTETGKKHAKRQKRPIRL